MLMVGELKIMMCVAVELETIMDSHGNERLSARNISLKQCQLRLEDG